MAIITKLVGCGLPARMLGMSWRDSAVLGFGMVSRGEVTMVVALLALNQGPHCAASLCSTGTHGLVNHYRDPVGTMKFVVEIIFWR